MSSMSAALQPELSTSEHCYFAFAVLDGHLSGSSPPEPNFRNVNTALFVTWNKVRWLTGLARRSAPIYVRSTLTDKAPLQASSGGDHRLRGCIGTLSPRWLHQGLKDYALTSALRDGRFQPITARELPSLTVKVSLISCFEEAASWRCVGFVRVVLQHVLCLWAADLSMPACLLAPCASFHRMCLLPSPTHAHARSGACSDWVVGKHGIQIEFVDSMGATRSATYLPEVAHEQGWDVEEAIHSLIRKAGYNGQITDTIMRSIRLVRYQSTVCSMAYDDYAAMKKLREGMTMEECAQNGYAVAFA